MHWGSRGAARVPTFSRVYAEILAKLYVGAPSDRRSTAPPPRGGFANAKVNSADPGFSGVAPTRDRGKNLLQYFDNFFSENCMKMKEIGPEGVHQDRF